jgi:peroxiredoxin
MFEMGIANLKDFGIGQSFVDFSLPDTQTKMVSHATFKGKITLVDFWASWCKPCRKKHPELIALHQKYAKGNFQIVSISIDDDTKKWTKAIAEDQLPWVNLWDHKKEVSKALGIQAIPFNYLLDETWKIIGINLSVEKITALLDKAKTTS